MKRQPTTAPSTARKMAPRQAASSDDAATAGPAADPEGRGEQVRLMAYYLYERRGREDGRELEDWLQVETLIQAQGSQPDAPQAAAAH